MTLAEFLEGKTVVAVETLPDDQLINVVLKDGTLHGVVVEDLPVGVTVLRHEPVVTEHTTITAGELSFDTTGYVMLPA
jgi:hypothetical protein